MTLVRHLAVALIALVPASIALAQPKPALVKDVDLAARAPYQETLSRLDCDGFSGCSFTFSTVPAGKRLVITWVGARYYVNVGTTDSLATLVAPGTAGATLWVAPPANAGAGTQRVIDSPVQLYVDAGLSPTLQVDTSSGLSGTVGVTLVGHYVSVP